MKMKDLASFSSFDEIIVVEKMSNLNATLKDTVQKADEGENCSCFDRFGLVYVFLVLFDVLIVD